MSDQESRLCVQLLTEVFGAKVGRVVADLCKWTTKTLPQIISSTNLPAVDVRSSVAVLIQHGFVTYSSTRRPGTVDYTLHIEKIIAMVRYPRFMYLVKSTYGDEAEVILEEILKSGSDSASKIIFRSTKRLNASVGGTEVQISVDEVWAKFRAMVDSQLLSRCGEVINKAEEECPTIDIDKQEMFTLREVDLKEINGAVLGGGDLAAQPDSSVLWGVNVDRFHQVFRDQVMIAAATRRIDKEGGNLMKSLLNLISTIGDPWITVSTHFNHPQIERQVEADWSKDSSACKHLNQYLRVMGDDRSRFVDRVGDAGGGQFTINVKHILDEITLATLDNIVLERFGSKALRIFRLVREKRYVEEGGLQQVVMIPAKETKMLTYQLLENHFIQLQELRKAAASTGISKAFYLFYVDMVAVVRNCIAICHKSLFNSKDRAQEETKANARLLEKQERIESIYASMKASGAAEEQMEEVSEMMSPPEKEAAGNVHKKLDKLTLATSQTDETLFILQMYLKYKTLK